MAFGSWRGDSDKALLEGQAAFYIPDLYAETIHGYVTVLTRVVDVRMHTIQASAFGTWGQCSQQLKATDARRWTSWNLAVPCPSSL